LFFFLGEFSPFFGKEIESFLDFLIKKSVNSNNFSIFWGLNLAKFQ